MPAQKKDGSVRARVNRAATARTVGGSTAKRTVPKLPDHPTDAWHSETLRWWRDLWLSPLPESWQSFDMTTLFTVALAFNDIWIAPSATARKEALSEFRLQRKEFFIAPYNRLQGEIVFEEAESAKERGDARRQRRTAPPPKPGDDPRTALRAVK